MLLLALAGVLALGIFMVVFGAGFFGGLFILASVVVTAYLAIKNPQMLKP